VVAVLPAAQAGRIEIEARIAGGNGTAVAVGQDAFVRPDGVPSAARAAIRGTVVHIAWEAAAMAPRSLSAAPGLIVRIALDRDPSADNRLRPGTPATVDVVVGQTSVVGFLTGGTQR
jgi:hypothetical protein